MSLIGIVVRGVEGVPAMESFHLMPGEWVGVGCSVVHPSSSVSQAQLGWVSKVIGVREGQLWGALIHLADKRL